MAKQYPEINDKLAEFIDKQQLYFVASAATEGRVNMSPKGGDTFRQLGANRVAWLNLTGSGNETAAHIRDVNRVTVMFCAFEGAPMILRLYGTAQVCYPGDDAWDEMSALFPQIAGSRQIYDMQVELVQTSCGFAVPFFDFVGERDTLFKWAENRGEDGLQKYWAEKNVVSIDGFETGMREQLAE